jgi:hypothetical protein
MGMSWLKGPMSYPSAGLAIMSQKVPARPQTPESRRQTKGERFDGTSPVVAARTRPRLARGRAFRDHKDARDPRDESRVSAKLRQHHEKSDTGSPVPSSTAAPIICR